MNAAWKTIDTRKSCYVRSFTYPGERPDFPYLIDGPHLYPLNTDSGLDYPRWFLANTGQDINRYLATRNETRIGDRYPVLAYGANRNPNNLAWKLMRANIAGTIIGLPVRIQDADVVAANMFHSGHMYADLIWDRNETRDVHVDAVVLLLDIKQLEMINKTERVPVVEILENGENFRGTRLSLFENITLDGQPHRVFALGYVSWANTWAPHGKPIAYRNINAINRKLHEMTPIEMFELVQQCYRQDQSLQEMISRMDMHWKHVRHTRVNGYDVDWFKNLIDEINGDGFIDDNGQRRSGIRDAEMRGSLLSPKDTWLPGVNYTVNHWQNV